jgi:ribose transport system substrate-binding protein
MSRSSHPGRRRAAASIAAAAAAVALSASSAAGAGGKPNLAIITASTTQNAFQEMTFGAQAAAQQLGANLNAAAPSGVNPTAEVQLFQAAMQTSKNGIAAMTTAPSDFVRPFSQAVAAGVPVVAVDAAPLPGSNVTTFVGNSNTQVGALMAQQVVKKIPAGVTGEVVLGNDVPGLPLLQFRINGMIAVLKAQRPKLKIVGPFNVGSEPTQNYNSWENVVKAHPNAVAYLAPGDQDAVSFLHIERQTGKHYLVGACDVDPVALQAVQAGYVDALGDPHHFLKGYIATYLLYQHAKGKALPKGWWNPGAGVITQSNVGQIMKREQSNTTRLAYYKSIITQEIANPSAYIKSIATAN